MEATFGKKAKILTIIIIKTEYIRKLAVIAHLKDLNTGKRKVKCIKKRLNKLNMFTI